jgi:hypothetical protein
MFIPARGGDGDVGGIVDPDEPHAVGVVRRNQRVGADVGDTRRRLRQICIVSIAAY